MQAGHVTEQQQQPQKQMTLINYTRELDEWTKEREEQHLLNMENYEVLENLKLAVEEHIVLMKAAIDQYRSVRHHQCLIFQGRGSLHKHVACRRESKFSH